MEEDQRLAFKRLPQSGDEGEKSLQHVPYCGAPPTPDLLLQRWNLDPLLLLTLGAILVAYFVGARHSARRGAAIPSNRQFLFALGWLTTTLALVSPLCPLSVALFSARVAQHAVLALVAAPLVMVGRPGAAFAALLRRDPPALAPAPMTAACCFAAIIWFWHSPAAYAATFSSGLIYWTMHLTAYGVALWLWAGLLTPSPTRIGSAIAAGLVSTVQMGLLGALITLSPRAFYAPHALTTAAWHLTPLQDQQLGGAIMWMPGCVVFLALAMFDLAILLKAPRLPRGLRLVQS